LIDLLLELRSPFTHVMLGQTSEKVTEACADKRNPPTFAPTCRWELGCVVRHREDDALLGSEDGIVWNGFGSQCVVHSLHLIAPVYDGILGADAGGTEANTIEKTVVAGVALLSFLQSSGGGRMAYKGQSES
jgi:hypothetical protein